MMTCPADDYAQGDTYRNPARKFIVFHDVFLKLFSIFSTWQDLDKDRNSNSPSECWGQVYRREKTS
jgi:hypothetical protein